MKDTQQMALKEKLAIAGAAGLSAATGGILGVIACYQQWLG